MNTREKGRQFEFWLLNKVKEIDPQARLTRASGASFDKADIQCNFAFIEAKNWNKKNVIMQIEDWNHLLSNQPINTLKISLYAFQNAEERKFIIMDAEEFFTILAERGD
jgi:hypothetical protein